MNEYFVVTKNLLEQVKTLVPTVFLTVTSVLSGYEYIRWRIKRHWRCRRGVAAEHPLCRTHQ
jgi:hypothetical protein